MITIKHLSQLLLTVLATGLITMLSIVWDSKVSQAEYQEFKSKMEVDIAVIKTNTEFIKEKLK